MNIFYNIISKIIYYLGIWRVLICYYNKNKECELITQQNDILTQQNDILTTTNIFNNKSLFELLYLYVGYNESIDLTNITELTINNTQGYTLCKYPNVSDINLSNIKIDDVLINDNNIHFLGFINNDNYIYIIIPNIINNSKINVLQIGNDCSIQIIHNFIPVIQSIVYIKNNDDTFNIFINGKNIFSFSRVTIRPLNNDHTSDIIDITDFTTSGDYTNISCNNIEDIYSKYDITQYIIEIYNYSDLHTSYSFESSSFNLFTNS